MTIPIEMWLNDRLVIKNFGIHPERGRRLRLLTMRSTAGVKWKQKRVKLKNGNWMPLGEPFIVRDEITVDAMIALHPVRGKRGLWRVYTDAKWHNQVIQWLVETCEAKPPDVDINWKPVKKPVLRRSIKQGQKRHDRLSAREKMIMGRVDNG